MINGFDIQERYENLPHGELRLQAIKNAIALADAEKDYEFMYIFRSDLMSESELYGDSFQAFLTFPEMIKIFDEHEERLDEYKHDYMWEFKWILSDCESFYQVSKAKVYELFAEFRKRCERYGYSLRPYYQCLYNFEKFCDKQAAKKAYQQFILSKRGELADCYACELNTMVKYELHTASMERALETAYPILSGQVSCVEIPAMTYENIMSRYYELGDFEKAEEYRKKCYRRISKESTYLSTIGIMLKLYSKTDLTKGVKLFEKHLTWEFDSKNSYSKMEFYMGAAAVFTKLAQKKDEVKLQLPEKFKLYKADGIYSTKALAEYYQCKSLDLINKFDKRNESDFYMKEYNYAME